MDSPAGAISDQPVLESPSEANDVGTMCKHQPLDTSKQSIRPVSIQKDLSAQRFIRCHIYQTTIGDTYQCLSYKQGSLRENCEILMYDETSTERRYRVGNKFYDFLHIVHKLKQETEAPSASQHKQISPKDESQESLEAV